jgi:hypothetical protein
MSSWGSVLGNAFADIPTYRYYFGGRIAITIQVTLGVNELYLFHAPCQVHIEIRIPPTPVGEFSAIIPSEEE